VEDDERGKDTPARERENETDRRDGVADETDSEAAHAVGGYQR